MRTFGFIAVLAAVAAAGPATAQSTNQEAGGVPTMTQERLRAGEVQVPWADLIGLIGLFGLLGLRRDHAEDSYHPSALE